MSEKKGGFFSKLKGKLLKNKEEEELYEEYEEYEEDFEDEYEEVEYEDDEEYEDEEVEQVQASSSEDTEPPPSPTEEFPEEFEEDDLESQLGDRSIDEDDDEEDDEAFEAQEMVFSDAQKEELEEEVPDKTDEVDVAALREKLDDFDYADEDDFEEVSDIHNYSEFEMPKQSRKAAVMGFFASKKAAFASLLKKPSDSIKNVRAKSDSGSGGISWDEFINSIFSPDNRRNIHRAFIISLTCVFTYVAGKSLALSLQGKDKSSKKGPQLANLGTIPNYRKDLAQIRQANLFNAKEEEVVADKPRVVATPKPPPEVQVCTKASKTSSLPIKLMGTLVLQDSVKSLAAVQVRGKKKLFNIREGEKVANMAEIGRIDNQKVIFKNLKSGRCEFVQSSKKKSRKTPRETVGVVSPRQAKKIVKNQRKDSRIKNTGNKFNIKKSLRDEMLSNIGEVLTQAKAIPIKNPDGTLSFKVTEIVPDSIYSKLNIQNGDIINAINGKRIQNVNEVMSMFGRIKEFDNFQLSILRNGAEENLEYKFE